MRGWRRSSSVAQLRTDCRQPRSRGGPTSTAAPSCAARISSATRSAAAVLRQASTTWKSALAASWRAASLQAGRHEAAGVQPARRSPPQPPPPPAHCRKHPLTFRCRWSSRSRQCGGQSSPSQAGEGARWPLEAWSAVPALQERWALSGALRGGEGADRRKARCNAGAPPCRNRMAASAPARCAVEPARPP